MNDARRVSVAEAAELLKMTTRGVTKALNEGRLRGEKIGKSWTVLLDTEPKAELIVPQPLQPNAQELAVRDRQDFRDDEIRDLREQNMRLALMVGYLQRAAEKRSWLERLLGR